MNGEIINKNMISKSREDVNLIKDEYVIKLIYEHIITEFKRIQKIIQIDNNSLAKKNINNNNKKLTSSILNPSHDMLIRPYGSYDFEIYTNSVDAVIYVFGTRYEYKFNYYNENGNLTKIGKLYKKTLTDLFFYNLPDDVRKNKIRKRKIKNMLL